MKKNFLEIGKIVSPHGIMGEVKVYPWCDTPDFLAGFDTLYFHKGKDPVSVQQARVHKNMVIVKLVGTDNVEAAQALRGQVLYAARAYMPLEKGEYFIQDLIGLSVVDADTGEEYGILSDVSQTGANDVYHISKPGEKEKLVPAIKDVVVETDVDGGTMKIRPLKGLFDDAD
ncbi:MAG: ribosome maturation factor RimM [Oscillospiraceae bacterium]|nr:ribosome maturation factor RimM [Oscillospiraceae bacterium]